jgi:hypothetical protein
MGLGVLFGADEPGTKLQVPGLERANIPFAPRPAVGSPWEVKTVELQLKEKVVVIADGGASQFPATAGRGKIRNSKAEIRRKSEIRIVAEPQSAG